VTEPVWLLLVVLLILQVKHFVADFVVQTPYQFLKSRPRGAESKRRQGAVSGDAAGAWPLGVTAAQA
jgi:hypothetical protein